MVWFLPFFDFWRVDLSEEAFIAPPRPFDRSFITRMMSHLPARAQDAQLVEEEDIPEPEPHPASPPPILPTDLYSTLFTSVNQLTLSHTQLCENFYSMASHFAASQRFVEMHLT